ncbi:centrosomal protein of 55 kDa [Chanos chanos]|uniref:Centrosomal protein of 55 kDa n=1 Tax=Chanos chanos TaxID=29144 RepID=A0A6J2VIW5_CHACN|nr:centrosomal protein of 55 kDa [Chanos chanos]
MATRGTKETIVNKLGFKSNGSKSLEAELEKLKKENAHLKRSLDEMSKRNGKHPDSDKAKLLERILALETLREKNSQQLLAKDQEIGTLRQQVRAAGGEVVASLQSQLDQKRKEAEQREKQFQSLSQETENLKNKLVAVTERCQALEKRDPKLQVPSGDVAVVQEQLRDALEKNQHWLVYDQQREAYVKGILARTAELERQLNQANQALQKQHKESNSEEKSSVATQEHYDKLLLTAKKELEAERAQLGRVQAELAEMRAKLEERCREVAEAQGQLQAERQNSRQALSEERKCGSDRAQRLQAELESADNRLEEERKRTAELLLQVNLLQKSLLNQHEEQKRIAVLEQQIKLSAKDFENEKLDRQSLQQQLHKVLKELRKARDQITRLESTRQQRESRFSEPSSYDRLETERMTITDVMLPATSPSKTPNLLDESFLECPKCRAPYPTSQHRELLAHIDYCFA